MFTQDQLKEIEKTIKEFFQKAALDAEVSIGRADDLTIPVSLNMETPQVLIGEGGQTLAEIQHLLKRIIRRKVPQQFYVDLDINDYKKKKFEYLKELARAAADEVALSKQTKEFSPMPAYERRIIHLELASRPDIASESIGEGPDRRIVVRPYP